METIVTVKILNERIKCLLLEQFIVNPNNTSHCYSRLFVMFVEIGKELVVDKGS